MKPKWQRIIGGLRQTIITATTIATVCLFAVGPACGQAAPPKESSPTAAAASKKEPTAGETFKSVQILKNISVDEFMDTMGFMAASLSYNCSDCHNLSNFAEELPTKKTARKMLLMVNTINKDNFGGARNVTCFTCHNDAPLPRQTPSLAQQYANTFLIDPNEVLAPANSQGIPTADQILDKYIQALGGADKLAAITSLTGKGTYGGYDTNLQDKPVELYAKAPNERSMVIHDSLGDIIWTTDGRGGWIASPANVVTMTTLTGGDLESAKLDALLFFPTGIKKAFTTWRSAVSMIDDKDVTVAIGSNAGKPPVKLFFDKATGLLQRAVRYSPTSIGLVVSEVDYSDYRPVNGVQVPFKYLFTWTDGQSTMQLSDVQANASIDAAKFAKPATPPPAQQ